MKLFVLLMFALLPAALFAAPVPKDKVPAVDLRDEDGKVVIAADQITVYNWDTHTLTLKDADLKKKLCEKLKFTVCVDGKPVFEVRRMSPLSSGVHRGPVVVSLSGEQEPAEEVTIDGGYPGLIAGDPDLRQVPALKDALEKAGKLKPAKK